jgi:short/branched chain acyl-CoA dehydrogenase
MPIYRFGTAEQRQRWLPELCAGERLAAFGLTEAGGGSDIPGGMRTTARLEAGEWVVDGTKAFITNSGTSITSLVTVLAITGRDNRGGKEISSIIIPNGTAGFVPGPEYSKVGWCASDTRELSFTGCRVPEQNLLGERGRATPSSCGSWTRAGWRSPRWPPARPWTMPGPPPRSSVATAS